MALNPANDLLKGYAFMENALTSREERDYTRQQRAGISRASSYESTFVDPETFEERGTDYLAGDGLEQTKAFYNTDGKALLNQGVDTDKFDSELVDIKDMGDGTYVPLIRQTNKSTGEYTVGPLTQNRTSEDGDKVVKLTLNELQQRVRADIAKINPNFNSTYMARRNKGAQADTVDTLVNDQWLTGDPNQLPMRGEGVGAQRQVPSTQAPAAQDQAPGATAYGITTQPEPTATPLPPVQGIGTGGGSGGGSGGVIIPEFLQEEAADLDAKIQRAESATGRGAQNRKRSLDKLKQDRASLGTSEDLAARKDKIEKRLSNPALAASTPAHIELTRQLDEINAALGDNSSNVPLKTGKQPGITEQQVAGLEPKGTAKRATEEKAVATIEKNRSKTGVVNEKTKNNLLRLHRLNPEKYDLGWVTRVMETGKMTDLDYEKFKLDKAYKSVLAQPKPIDINQDIKERRALMMDNAEIYAYSTLGSDKKNASAGAKIRTGQFVRAMDGTPWLAEKWNIDERTGVGMNVMWEGFERMEQANKDGKSAWYNPFGEDEKWESLTPFIAEQFMSGESQDIKPYYKRLSQLPGATKASTDAILTEAIRISRQSGAPIDKVLDSFLSGH